MFLLDTVALSEGQRPSPDAGFQRFIDVTADPLLLTSVMVLGEIWRGIRTDPQAARRARLEQWFEDDLLLGMADRTLPVSTAIAQRWGEIVGDAYHRGIPLPPVDALIAATAIVHDLAVVTRNTRDFERCGARTVNPWAG